MLNDFADNVYVLNLEEESFKYEILKRKLDKKGIEHERFIATPATKYWRMPNNLTKLELIDDLRKIALDYSKYDSFCDEIIFNGFKNINNNLGCRRSYGAMGCVISHKRIFKDAIDKGYENIILLQDDIYFHKEFEKLLKESQDKIKLSDIFYFGASEWSAAKKKNCWSDPNWNYYTDFCYKPTRGSYGFFAVRLSKKSFKEILKLLNYNFFAADQCLSLVASNLLKESSWVAYPNLIIPDTSYSRTHTRTSPDKPDQERVLHRDFPEFSKSMGWNLKYYDLTEPYYKF